MQAGLDLAGVAITFLISTLILILFTPRLIILLRTRLFVSLNGDSGIQLPRTSDEKGALEWRQAYASRKARIRSAQSQPGLSDLFWYFLSPGPDIHQEHVESGTILHTQIAAATTLLVKRPTEEVNALANKYAKSMLAEGGGLSSPEWTYMRLRDVFFPVFAGLFHEMLFEREATPAELAMLVASGSNIISTIKGTALRDMSARRALTEYVKDHLKRGACAAAKDITTSLTLEERALHIQGVFLHTGVVQMSEAMAHVCLALANHPRVQAKLESSLQGAEDGYLDAVLSETLRLYPLFGIAHRITTGPVLDFPADSVLLFNYLRYQTIGYERAHEFVPERWCKDPEEHRPEGVSLSRRKDANYAPFGAMRNRPCPGQRIAQLLVAEFAKCLVPRVRFATSVAHSRSLPCRGLCVAALMTEKANVGEASCDKAVAAVAPAHTPPPLPLGCLARMRVRHSVDGFFISLQQLVIGTWQNVYARHKRMAFRYSHDRVLMCPRNGRVGGSDAVPAYHYTAPPHPPSAFTEPSTTE